MIDLALKMLLDEKARFAATVLGVGFAAALVLIQVGLFFGLLENASITIDRLDADLWVTARNTPNVDFGNPSPMSASPVGPRRGPGRQPDRLVCDRGLPTGARSRSSTMGSRTFPAWQLPLGRRVGRPRRPPPRPLCDARRVGRAAVRPVPGRRLPRVFRANGSRSSAGPARRSRSRPALSPSSTTAWPNRSRPTSSLAGRHSSSSELEPGADAAAVGARSAVACLITTSTPGRVGRAVARLLDREYRVWD